MNGSRPCAIQAHDDGVDRWEMVRAAPAAGLAAVIRQYCSYWEETGSFAARRELASTSGVLIFALGDPLEIIGADGRTIILEAGQGFAGGIADATSISRGGGRQAGIHVFMPLEGLATVVGAPLAELANKVAPLADLIGREADDLGHALGSAPDHGARFDLLDAFFLRHFAREPKEDPVAGWAARRLVGVEAPSSTHLAREIGWSRKHFAHRVRAATGFGPDRLRRLARFERFAAALSARPDDSLAGLAAEHGFADQAHLTHEVRAFCAMTPGELRARQIPASGGVRDT